MEVLHSGWLVEPGDEFTQQGHLFFWLECQPTGDAAALHVAPRAQLDALLQRYGLDPDQGEFSDIDWLLPHADSRPLPGPQFINEGQISGAIGLDTATLPVWISYRPLADLNTLAIAARYVDDNLQGGQDLLFWHRVSSRLQQAINADQYLPTLQARQAQGGIRYIKKWQLASPGLTAELETLARQMPLCCSQDHQPGSLLAHFCDVMLDQWLVEQSQQLPRSYLHRLAGTPLEDFLDSSEAMPVETLDGDQYRHWKQWEWTICQHRQAGNGFEIAFQLSEPVKPDGDWLLDILLISQRDLSFQLAVEDYYSTSDTERKALAKLLGDQVDASLLIRLGQACRIYPALWQCLAGAVPGGIVLDLAQAFDFLKEQAWLLEDAGYIIRVPAFWTASGRQRNRLRLRMSSSATESENAPVSGGLLSLDQLRQFDYRLAMGDQPVDPGEWQQLLAAKTPLVQFRGEWVEVDPAQLAGIRALLEQTGDQPLDAQALLSKLAEQDELVELESGDHLAQMLARLNDTEQFALLEDPPRLNATLRDYQKRGVSWLRYLEQLGLGGCLADDMGLGKTIQVIAAMTLDEESPGPSLLIAPTSVIGNWVKEIERFAPQLKTHLHHGSKRSKQAAAFTQACQEQDLVITTYTLANRDKKLLGQNTWHRLILDEAQQIKNSKSAQTKAICQLKARHRLALTGTPVENRLMDLWSIFHFLNPGYLGSNAQFKKRFETPIQRANNAQASGLLKKLVQPLILRRLKTDRRIIDCLPDKVENKRYCNLTQEQASLYEAVVQDVEQQLDSADGIERQGLMLSTLMRLKQICNHPTQFLQDNSAFSPERSHKLEYLLALIDEAISDGDSALVFTQFTEIGGQVTQLLRQQKGINTYYLHGGVPRPQRERMIQAFQSPDTAPSVFVLSLKAGGVGITLTRANHVFHFDRWWNPAVEDQATDRAFRIGQKKNVMVHKFVTSGSLEERIDTLLEEKKQLADSIVGSDESWLTQLSNAQFRALIQLNREEVIE